MPATSRFALRLARPVSRFLPGAALHRRALESAAAGDAELALGWVELALGAYRREMAIEPIARLRVHELMFRARLTGIQSADAPELLEIVQRLNRLDTLETLIAPFELRDAREVLAVWIEAGDAPAPDAGWQVAPEVVAAAA